MVNEGDRVHRGEPLAIQNVDDLEANLAADQSAVDVAARSAASADARVATARYTATLNIGQGSDQVRSARASVATAQQTLAEGRTDLGRYEQLLRNGYIAQQQVAQQQTTVLNDQAAVRTAQASLASALTNQNVNGSNARGLQASNVASAIADANSSHAQVAQAQAQVKQLQAQISRATIVSPVDGTIVNRNLNPGEYPGSRTIFTIQQLNVVYAELNASSSDTFGIAANAPVTIAAAGTPQTYHGTVYAVLGQVDPGATNFTVKVLVKNPDQKLKAGIPVSGTVSLPSISGTGIPSTAFLDDTHSSIMINQQGKARQVKVRERADDGTTAIVTGVSNGQNVIANGQLGITQGEAIQGETISQR